MREKVVMEVNKFDDYILWSSQDNRLNAWHIALLAAIFIIAARQKRTVGIQISRRMIMTLSHIQTIPTYHKYFKELEIYGYFYYRPSYHPGMKSEIDLKQPLR